MSKYNELTIEEKNQLLNSYKLCHENCFYPNDYNTQCNIILEKHLYEILSFEKRGIELIGKHLISNGGEWFDNGSSWGKIDHEWTVSLELNSEITSPTGFTSYYKTYDIPNFTNLKKINFETSKRLCYDHYDWEEKKWIGNNGKIFAISDSTIEESLLPPYKPNLATLDHTFAVVVVFCTYNGTPPPSSDFTNLWFH